ncbi:outer membrane beta-barrel protein [Rhizobiaceae bacterium]|nr:outer membrane beta-barrel protein [Rhizobiaceae bacterium]
MAATTSLLRTAALALLLGSTAGVAQAEMTVSVGLGANASPHSSMDYDFNNGTAGSASVGWDGVSFEFPPVYNVRGTYWLDDFGIPQLGFGVTFTHAKVRADLDDDDLSDFSHLEFTDGINFLTANAFYRFDLSERYAGTALERFTPYVGAGVGAAIPHVEVSGPSLAQETREYQVTGVAGEAVAGVDYAFTDRISMFAEYKFNYGKVDADLEGGGSLDTDIISNQVFVGLTYKIF